MGFLFSGGRPATLPENSNTLLFQRFRTKNQDIKVDSSRSGLKTRKTSCHHHSVHP